MMKIRVENPAELVLMVCAADILRNTHAIERGCLIHAVSIGDYENRDPSRKDRGRPEEPIELFIAATVAVPVDDDEPGVGHR